MGKGPPPWLTKIDAIVCCFIVLIVELVLIWMIDLKNSIIPVSHANVDILPTLFILLIVYDIRQMDLNKG